MFGSFPSEKCCVSNNDKLQQVFAKKKTSPKLLSGLLLKYIFCDGIFHLNAKPMSFGIRFLAQNSKCPYTKNLRKNTVHMFYKLLFVIKQIANF